MLRRRTARDPRRGAVVLEAILVLPVLLIGVLAIVELSLLTSNLSWVKRASRDGASAAARITLPTAGPPPPEVIDAVTAALAERGAAWAEIRVDHNVGPAPPYVLTTGPGRCPGPAAVPPGEYVAVTVCVEESGLAPNLLQTYCFDLEGRFVSQTTIRPYQVP